VIEDIRERVGREHLRARIRRQAQRAVRPGIVALGGIAVGLAAFVYLTLHVERTRLVDSGAIAFEVDDASGVQPKVNEVRFRGIPAGKITKVEMRGTQPVVTVDMETEYGKVYRDAKAQLRPNTPLQDMYLNIVDRGTPAAGQATADDPVPAARTDTSVHISEVLNVFDGNERARLAHLLDGFGNGLEDRGLKLKAAFANLVPFVTVAARITDQLRDNDSQTRRLVGNTAVLTSELGRREAQLRRLVDQTSATMSTLQASSGDIDRTLAQLPGTIRTADSSFAAVRGVLPDVDRALGDLDPVADRLPESLRAIRRLATTATPAVRALERPVKRLVPLATTLAPTASALRTSVSRLLPQADTIDKTVKAVSQCLPEIYGFMAWDASMSKFGDTQGAAPRGNAVIGAASLGLDNPWETFPQICISGKPIGGRPAQESDKR
jgi:virulence factor Mce-like protein